MLRLFPEERVTEGTVQWLVGVVLYKHGPAMTSPQIRNALAESYSAASINSALSKLAEQGLLLCSHDEASHSRDSQYSLSATFMACLKRHFLCAEEKDRTPTHKYLPEFRALDGKKYVASMRHGFREMAHYSVGSMDAPQAGTE